MTRYRLANGLEVMLAPDAALDDVTVMVRYRVGEADDPERQVGLAHVAEHVMFDGTPAVGPGELARQIEEAGGANVEGRVNAERTVFVESIPPGGLPLALWLEADRMAHAGELLDKATVQREWVVADSETVENRQFGGSVPKDALWTEVFPAGHPYHLLGTRGSTMGLFGVSEVRDFLRTWYSPANATLILVGHFDAGGARALLETDFGALRGATPRTRPDPVQDQAPGDVRLEASSSMTADVVTLAWRTPRSGSPEDLALDVVSTLLESPNGQLRRDLIESGMAWQVTAHEASLDLASYFQVEARAKRGSDLDAAAKVILRALEDLARTLTPSQLEAAQRKRKADAIRMTEGSLPRAWRVLDCGRLDWGRYDRVDVEAIRRTLRTVILPARRVTLRVRGTKGSTWSGEVVSREERAL
ncbi:MAG TPA: pitrilysin family protein [Polyangiaceae bacterium]